jgi:hypothetical protein
MARKLSLVERIDALYYAYAESLEFVVTNPADYVDAQIQNVVDYVFPTDESESDALLDSIMSLSMTLTNVVESKQIESLASFHRLVATEIQRTIIEYAYSR